MTAQRKIEPMIYSSEFQFIIMAGGWEYGSVLGYTVPETVLRIFTS